VPALSTTAPIPSRLEAVRADTRETVREVLRLAWPAMGHMLLLSLVFIVDRIVLGRTDTTALASLQISTVVVWTLTTVGTAFSSATLAVAGRAFGAEDRERASQAIAASLAAALSFGMAFALIALTSRARWMAAAFPHAGAEVGRDVEAYLAIALPALPLAFFEAVAAASLQSIGDTRSPLFAALAGNALNIVVSATLVFGLLGLPALGVRGAAYGATSAWAVQSVALGVILLRRKSPLSLARALARPTAWSRDVLRKLVEIGTPAVFDRLAYAGGYLAFVALLAALGPAAMAQNQAISSIEAVAFLSAEGFGIAAGTLVAQKLGAGYVERAERAAQVAAFISVATLCALGLLFLAAPRTLLGVVSGDPSVVREAMFPLVLCAISQPFMGYAIVMRMALRGAGATDRVLLVTFAGTFLVRLPVAYFAGVVLGGGLLGAWAGCALDWMFEAFAFAWLKRRAGLEPARVSVPLTR